MDSGKRRSQRDYTLAFKLSVVDQVEKGELGYKEAPTALWHSGPVDGAGLVTQAWSTGLEPRRINSRAEEQVRDRANPPADTRAANQRT